jgi:hypothetical protein
MIRIFRSDNYELEKEFKSYTNINDAGYFYKILLIEKDIIATAIEKSKIMTVWNWVKKEKLREIEIPSDFGVYDIMKYNNEALIVSGDKKFSYWTCFSKN